MLKLICESICLILLVIMEAFLLWLSVSATISGIKERDAGGVVVGVVFGLIFLFVCLFPFAYTKKCPVCNEPYSYEYQYCPKDGARLEE